MSDSENSSEENVKKEKKSSDSESSSEEEMKKEDKKEEKKSSDSSSSSEEETKENKEISTQKKELSSSGDEIKGDNKKENKESSSSEEDSKKKEDESSSDEEATKKKQNESSSSQENAQKKSKSSSEGEETQSQKSGEKGKNSSEAEESDKESKKEGKESRSRVGSVSPMIASEQPRNPDAWAESPAGLTKRQVGLVMVGLMLGLFLASLDQTIVSTALPKIVSEFGRLDLYSWVIIAYLLTSTITIPIAGKLSDVFGRKVCFMAVIIIFECASIVCGASPDMITLIVFRAIQGIGGGGIISLVQIVIGDIVSIRQRGKFGGLFGVVWAGSSVLGPILGGVITDNATWRWIFYINIPIGVLSIIFVFFVLKIPGDSVKLRRELFRKIDYLGAVVFMAGIVLVLLGINFGGNQYAWNSVAVILCFILGGLIIISFFFVEWKIPSDPLIPLKVMVQRNVGLSNLVAFGFGWAMFGSISYFPEYFQVVHGDTPTTSGLKLIALMFGIVGASMLSGMLITKTGHYYPWPIIGGIFLLTGLGLVGGLLSPTINLYLLSFFIFITGLGIGSVIQTLVIIVQFSVERKNMAVGTAAIAFMRTMGGVVGVAVCGAVLTNQLSTQISPQEVAIVNGGYAAITQLPLEQQTAILAAYSNSLQYVFLSCIPAVGIATLLSLAIKREKIQKSEGAAPPVVADA